jgi:hypothetical protein
VEHLRPGAALESEVTLARACWIAALAVCPLSGASGHGLEFLLSRVHFQRDGVVRLEVTADLQDNLMLPDEQSAREAIRDLFQVSRGRQGEAAAWSRLAGIEFEPRTQLDPTAPLPFDPAAAGQAHRLITGVWRWRPDPGSEFQFVVDPGSAVDTLLWRTDESMAPGEGTRWKILISGDSSGWFSAPRAGSFPGGIVAAAVCGLVILGFSSRLVRIFWSRFNPVKS